MKFQRLALHALVFALGTSGIFIARDALAAQGAAIQDEGRSQDHDRGGDWDAPPSEFREVRRRGFHDGIEAGRDDFEHHHQPNIERARGYRHPPVPKEAHGDYREGFRSGYDTAFAHFRGDHDRDRDRQ
jgi:hypothetical protein